jgi:hypothetical protein
MTETDEPDTIRAGGWYLAMTHGGRRSCSRRF